MSGGVAPKKLRDRWEEEKNQKLFETSTNICYDCGSPKEFHPVTTPEGWICQDYSKGTDTNNKKGCKKIEKELNKFRKIRQKAKEQYNDIVKTAWNNFHGVKQNHSCKSCEDNSRKVSINKNVDIK